MIMGIVGIYKISLNSSKLGLSKEVMANKVGLYKYDDMNINTSYLSDVNEATVVISLLFP